MKKVKETGSGDILSEIWKMLGRQGAEILALQSNHCGGQFTCSQYYHSHLQGNEISENAPTTAYSATQRKSSSILWTIAYAVSSVRLFQAARLLVQRHREKNKPLHLDLENAFDRVPEDLNLERTLRPHVAQKPMCDRLESFTIMSLIRRSLMFILCMDTLAAEIQTSYPEQSYMLMM